ncbi:hypothetical protein ASPFODRAFT_65913 [Aspergillus luchuensis CBS 106.47]|uniref:Uncharacterized protein n=1 Tax=Aspergillus luchuensis (strain CBS 106.47) TaxID=1137211 RepID=A0A1M3T0F7_ASPLC|nr:hypothetical protein ASPFODRAFT_65913 [Aspergillus luchuensis CBS 106.47]
MRFLPESIKRPISFRDREDLARAFVALVRYWLSEASGEAALTTWGTMKQPAKAEESGNLPELSTSLRPPLVLDQVRTVVPYLSPPQLECAQLWIDEARILQDYSFNLVTLIERMWGLTDEGMMECHTPVVSGSHCMLQRLITPDIIARLLDLSASQQRRVSRRLQSMENVWDPTGRYPYSTADRLWSAAMRMERRWWRSLWPGQSHERPVTLSQVMGIFPLLEPDAVDQVAQILKRRAWRVGRTSATLEDVMLFLKREKRASDADIHYAPRRLGLTQEHTKDYTPIGGK